MTSPTYRRSERGTPYKMEQLLNHLNQIGCLHEVWHLGVTTDADDIEIGLELLKIPNQFQPRMHYKVIAGARAAIDAEENCLREAGKYLATAHRQPLINDKEKAIAIIQVAN